MRPRLAFAAFTLIALTLTPHASRSQTSAPGEPAFPAVTAIPVVNDHQYRASGSVRPLVLFWISRSNVGGARITRRRDEDGTIGLEMLTGSDPARAPFGVNRWGYIREIVRGNEAELVAVKTQTDEESLEEAKTNANNHDASRRLVFIREHVSAREAVAWTAVADVGQEVSFHDLDFVLNRMSTVTNWQERRLARPAGARPGFLTAFTELMDRTAKSAGSDRSAYDRSPKVLTYVHRAELFDLHEDQMEVVNEPAGTERGAATAVRARFWILNRKTAQSSGEFRVDYGLAGELAGVPLRMLYQPRWWLRTELTLDETAPYSAAK